jgi:RsmE family RNA methyltransferase
MNIALFTEDEFGPLLPHSDERVRHVLRVLKKGPGDEFKAGIENGLSGMARVESVGPGGMALSFRPSGPPPPLYPVSLILGFPRPIQANRILKDLASLGVLRIFLSGTDLGEKSYTQGSFFTESGWERAIREGASQAGNPLLPAVGTYRSVEKAIEAAEGDQGERAALDPVSPDIALRRIAFTKEKGALLAIGSERGWTDRERGALRSGGFRLAGLGERILRTETAATAAVALCLSSMGAI